MPETFLVTGALGCIGAWAARQLVAEGARVVAFDLGDRRHRLELVMEPDALAEVRFVRGDVTDLDGVERVMDDEDVTHVIHLAAMLIPLAKADPPRGAQVNVTGTVNLFEAVKRRGLPGLAYASSAAVYGREDGARVAAGAEGHPVTHYGVHKLANEGTARVYWRDDGVPSVGLRPFIVYGPGRDTGMTAEPTLAMAAAARGEGYAMNFGGVAQYQYAPDAARAFIDAARSPGEDAVVHNLGGPAVHMRDVVAAIEAAAPEVHGKVGFADEQLPLPDEFASELTPPTPLAQGVAETIALLRAGA